MVEKIFSMIRTVAAMSVISVLLEYLMPNGALQNSVRIVIGLVFLMVVSTPIFHIINTIP